MKNEHVTGLDDVTQPLPEICVACSNSIVLLRGAIFNVIVSYVIYLFVMETVDTNIDNLPI